MREETSPTLKESARKLLGECRLFRGLPDSKRAQLAARAHVRSFRQGETIFPMGAKGDCLMAIVSGRVRIGVTSPEGREMVLALLNAGEVLGELAVLDGRDRSADAIAQTACTVAVLDRRDVLSLLENEPAAWRAIVEMLCARLRSTDTHIAEIALLELPARLANVLLRLISTEQRTPAVKPQLKLSQRELGEIVGASRESVNKCLGQWQRSGIIQIDGTTITVTSKAALQRVAEAE